MSPRRLSLDPSELSRSALFHAELEDYIRAACPPGVHAIAVVELEGDRMGFVAVGLSELDAAELTARANVALANALPSSGSA